MLDISYDTSMSRGLERWYVRQVRVRGFERPRRLLWRPFDGSEIIGARIRALSKSPLRTVLEGRLKMIPLGCIG